MANRHILIILDGYGIAEDPSVSAVDAARKPFLDQLFRTYPHARLTASGLAVGLPEGQMGNSEVGHMNLGAGRVVYQDITRIDREIETGDFFANEVLREAAGRVAGTEKSLHLLGLFSDGGVHSSDRHLFALLELARREGLRPNQVCLHAFTDGRDTDPEGGLEYVRQFQTEAARIGVGRIASIVGRYYAMDRDHRWPRTQIAYDLLVSGKGAEFENPTDALMASYKGGITDEFVEPICIRPKGAADSDGRIVDGDSIIFFNFRADRARQLTRAFTQRDFDGFARKGQHSLHYVTFTPYHKEFGLPIAFPKIDLVQTIGEVVSSAGLRQLRAAETEKYPHVTFFFSGGREVVFEGEDRILIPSPKVPTYDLQPEMSAFPLAEAVTEALASETYALVVLNFANPDMVGHTGVFHAAVAAVEAVDACTKTVVQAALAHGYSVEIIADHGNSDKMRNPDGSPHTAHTTALVPHLIIMPGFGGPIRDGKLGDVAPTILKIIGLPVPAEMTGDVLI